MSTNVYTVQGMSCDHCAQAVTDEVGQLAGVSEVRVDLGAGTVVVVGDPSVSEDAVRGAVDEAGYTVVGRQ